MIDLGCTKFYLQWLRTPVPEERWQTSPRCADRRQVLPMIDDSMAKVMDEVLTDMSGCIPRRIGWHHKFMQGGAAGAKAIHLRLFATTLSGLLFAICQHQIPTQTIQAWASYVTGVRALYTGHMSHGQAFEAQRQINAMARHVIKDLGEGDFLTPNVHVATHLAQSITRTGCTRFTSL